MNEIPVYASRMYPVLETTTNYSFEVAISTECFVALVKNDTITVKYISHASPKHKYYIGGATISVMEI